VKTENRDDAQEVEYWTQEVGPRLVYPMGKMARVRLKPWDVVSGFSGKAYTGIGEGDSNLS
jgi:hypothetical protein